MSALRRTRSVAVLGGGIAAFAAAAAFRRALPEAQVTLFGGDTPEPEYAGAAAPTIHHFHRLVGIDPEAFRRRTGAVTVREAEIRRPGRPAFRLVPLSAVPHVDGAALHQLWLRRTAAGPAAGWADTARRAQRQEDRALGLGVRFDAEAYLALLGELAGHLAIEVTGDAATRAELAPAHDLVIDATEPAASSDWLAVEGVPGSLRWRIEPVTARARDAVETIELAGESASWDAAAWRASARADADAPAGRIRSPWQGKVLAIGRAGVRCETFDGQPLAVALAGIVRALELLPRPGASGREAAEYNRRSGAVHDLLLDWAAERWGVSAPVPAGLAALRRQFGERGRIPFRDEDPVPPGHWVGWLLGSGERPRHVDLTAMAISEERLSAIFTKA